MKEIPCKLKILDGKDVVELAGDSSTVVINEGDKVTISDSTIELLPYTPGEKVYLTVNEVDEYLDQAKEISKEDLIKELTKMTYSANRKVLEHYILELRDNVMTSLGSIKKDSRARAKNSLVRTSELLLELSKSITELVELDCNYGLDQMDDDRR